MSSVGVGALSSLPWCILSVLNNVSDNLWPLPSRTPNLLARIPNAFSTTLLPLEILYFVYSFLRASWQCIKVKYLGHDPPMVVGVALVKVLYGKW